MVLSIAFKMTVNFSHGFDQCTLYFSLAAISRLKTSLNISFLCELEEAGPLTSVYPAREHCRTPIHGIPLEYFCCIKYFSKRKIEGDLKDLLHNPVTPAQAGV